MAAVQVRQDAAAEVHAFLRKCSLENDVHGDLILNELNETVSTVLVLCPRDDTFLEILDCFGWDMEQQCFPKQKVDLAGLQFALSNKSRGFHPPSSNVAGKDQKNFDNATLTHSFVPQMFLDHIVDLGQNDSAHLRPVSTFFHGICLLVDISGFTKLSESFGNQGKDGIDGLRLATNKFMGRLVETIYAYGGDIIKFAGDAIICTFCDDDNDAGIPGASGISPRMSLRKSSFANQMTEQILHRHSMTKDDRQHSHQSPPPLALSLSPLGSTSGGGQAGDPPSNLGSNSGVSGGGPAAGQRYDIHAVSPKLMLNAIECAAELKDISTNGLTVHVALSCGEICFGVLGGHQGRWECLISGACILELSACLDDAPSQQAVMTGKCAECVRGLGMSHTTVILEGSTSDAGGEGNDDGGVCIAGGGAAGILKMESMDSTCDALKSVVKLKRLPSGNYHILNVLRDDPKVLKTASLASRSMAAEGRKRPTVERAIILNPVKDNAVRWLIFTDPLYQEMISALTPTPVLAMLEGQGALSGLSEIRAVTTMFMKVL
jgi:class 3 adenylate cyclase